MTATCQNRSPRTAIMCQSRPHPRTVACRASGNDDGVHWQLTWWRPGVCDGERADGLPWPREGEQHRPAT